MKLPGFFAVFSIVFLFSCNKKKEKEPVITDLLVDSFDFTKDAVFDSTNVPQHLRKIVKDISTLNIYETEQGGKGALDTPANFKNFKKLYKAASEQELLLLTDNKNSVVAVYASVGLSEKNNKYTVPIFQKILKRKGIIHIQNGCILSDDHPAEPVYWKQYYKLKPEELNSDPSLKQLDSMVLFMSNSSDLILTTALRNRTYSVGLKNQIAKQAFEHHRQPALLYLHSWHKKEYAELLQKELASLIENDSIDAGRKRTYISMLLSLNNPGNKKKS
ncbi:hypothetical protein [Chryseobacterium lathyri]|uniref:Lipoprotein n=1 Tax=Chryseobacterium lathyri TaxID=395933 RepID=A0ABT9SLQ0_9FLAO|nr:hypothetical protein [Chryseobacterium lathyri]MDP9960359.1 hypothetical protein [Chryseobacterium lathyri]